MNCKNEFVEIKFRFFIENIVIAFFEFTYCFFEFA